MLLPKRFKVAYQIYVIQYFKENNNSNTKDNNDTVRNKGEEKRWIRKRSHERGGYTKSMHRGLVLMSSSVVQRLLKMLGIMLVNSICILSS